MHREQIFAHGLPADQMLLNDPLDYWRRAGMIPGAIRIDHGDGALLADAEAIGFGPVNATFAPGKSQFRQAQLQIIPGRATFLARRALRLRLVGAEEDVAL